MWSEMHVRQIGSIRYRRPSRVLTPTIVVHRLHVYSALEQPPITAPRQPGRARGPPLYDDNARRAKQHVPMCNKTYHNK